MSYRQGLDEPIWRETNIVRREIRSLPVHFFGIVAAPAVTYMAVLTIAGALLGMVPDSFAVCSSMALMALTFLVQYCRYSVNRLETYDDRIVYHDCLFRTTTLQHSQITDVEHIHSPDGLGFWIVKFGEQRIRIPESMGQAWPLLDQIRMNLDPNAGPIDGTYYAGRKSENRYMSVLLLVAHACFVAGLPAILPDGKRGVEGIAAVFLLLLALLVRTQFSQKIKLKNREISLYDWRGTLTIRCRYLREGKVEQSLSHLRREGLEYGQLKEALAETALSGRYLEEIASDSERPPLAQ